MTRVLVVDDEDNIRVFFEKILTNAGDDVIKAAHLIDACGIPGSNQFDVAIIDRLLSPHNSMDLIKHINKIQPFCTTILMSAFPNFESASERLKHDLFIDCQRLGTVSLLAAGIIHDFNNLFMSISGLAQLSVLNMSLEDYSLKKPEQ
jgi:CheY-like chemotaxis protein